MVPYSTIMCNLGENFLSLVTNLLSDKKKNNNNNTANMNFLVSSILHDMKNCERLVDVFCEKVHYEAKKICKFYNLFNPNL